MPHLSKSQFIRGLQCHKSLWLYKNRPELREQPGAAAQAAFDKGTEVGLLAHKLFPKGKGIEYTSDGTLDNLRRTRELMASGCDTIYEATFTYDDVLVMVDILNREYDGWSIYEVKSSTEVKPVYVDDVAVQYYVLTGAGLKIHQASVVHINNKYVLHGDLDVEEFFTIADVTGDVLSRQEAVRDNIHLMKSMLHGDMPDIDIGLQCSNPYDCDFKSYCWRHIPSPSVFDLTRLRINRKFELYRDGVLRFEDIPDSYRLTPAQRMQVDADCGNLRYINKKHIKSFLASIEEPIGFLDFETFQQAIPDFNDQRPFQQIPFQYSLHVYENGEMAHYEYLAKAGNDPRREFINRLMDDIVGCRTILVYNQGFENGRMRELASMYPEYSADIADIIARVVDLMKPFQDRDYYVKEMCGSYSIKKVLPALVPELSYDGLEIANGGVAMQAFADLQQMEDDAEIERIRANLLKYCEMDTLAMVRIWEHLTDIVS